MTPDEFSYLLKRALPWLVLGVIVVVLALIGLAHLIDDLFGLMIPWLARRS